ncbi:hypothetical protein GCM10023085_08180 [Actinomadura viridis]|uniref:RimJ/RimL family protein N-acetyltransferase n=1 Tax=Actinomadura viridis TaxID=58110 RepID=A0A931DII6_9ACTN|nr:GNAT family protein [Actinomadura viridis]MBG6091829.1 RimJ/RimL family protein N-acetyltransferase [Actinomadura viridis]
MGETAPVRLLRVDEDVLERLLHTAVTDAEPIDVMPPVDGPPGWNTRREEAFRAYHRARREGLDGPLREVTYAIEAGGEVVGAARLEHREPPGTPGVLEAGVWLGRSARGLGIGTAVVRALLAETAASGAATMIAETTAGNAAAVAALRRLGASLTTDAPTGQVHAELPAVP